MKGGEQVMGISSNFHRTGRTDAVSEPLNLSKTLYETVYRQIHVMSCAGYSIVICMEYGYMPIDL